MVFAFVIRLIGRQASRSPRDNPSGLPAVSSSISGQQSHVSTVIVFLPFLTAVRTIDCYQPRQSCELIGKFENFLTSDLFRGFHAKP